MTTFRILHVSDLHIARVAESLNVIDVPSRFEVVKLGASRIVHFSNNRFRYRYPTSHDRAALAEVARHAYYDPELDLILVTGDVATTGEQKDLGAAAAHFAKPTAGWMTPDGATLAIRDLAVLLPGNHDRYERPRFPFGAGGTAFDTTFARFWPVGQFVHTMATIGKDGEWLVIVGADFSLRAGTRSIADTPGQGEVYAEVAEALRLETQRMRERVETRRGTRCAVVWAVHFAPDFPGGKATLRLRNEQLLFDTARDAGVRYILCGHTHEKKDYSPSAAPGVHVLCAGTAAAFRAKEGKFIHTREIDVMNGAIQGEIRTIDHPVL